MLESSRAMLIAFLALLSLNYGEIGAFNLSPVPSLVINMPNLRTSLPKARSSYFGFSIVLRKNSILIGAPRAQSTLESQSTINETGAVYRCPFQFKRTTEPIVTCQPYVFEDSSNLYYSHFHSLNEVRDYQWLGGTMDGSTNDNDPFLVCAPRFDGGERYDEDVHDYLHGICYSSANTLEEEPSKIGFWKLKPFTVGRQVLNDVYFHQMGQLGFSAHITPNNKEYIMGAPGINNWAGSAVRFNTRTAKYDIPSQFSMNQLALTGYAVASGYLNSQFRNKLYYVTTSPHENMELGQAYLYEYDYDAYGMEDEILIRTVFKGTQYGEYFGYATLVCDINGDKLDDVLVTAPQYRLDGTIDIGAIYVFINVGNFQFQRQIIVAPFRNEARFGTTISILGDINRDGFNDIAVGAPVADDGNGAVAIYLGSKSGLSAQPSQVIRMPTNDDMTGSSYGSYFGHGLSKGADIDGNGYNDLAIGAPNDEIVYIYRSYPIVNVLVSIRTSVTRLDLDAEFVDYRICFRTNSEFVVPLILEIKADVKLKRIAFEDNGYNELQERVLAANFEKCHTYNATILFLAKQVFVPIKTTVTHSLTDDGRLHKEKNFCTRCAVLDPNISNTTTNLLTYQHGCANDICEVDLSIKAFNVPSELTIGSSNTLAIRYLILSNKEKAFDTQVIIRNSLNLTLARIPSNCNADQADQHVVCDIAKDEIFLQDFEYLDIEFAFNSKIYQNEIIITASVQSMGNERNIEDNTSEVKINLKSYSDLEIVGLATENPYFMKDNVETIDFQYKFKLHNFGPSAIKNVDFWLYTPIASNHSHFIDNIKLNVTMENQEVPYFHLTMFPNEPMESYMPENIAYNSRENFVLPHNRTIFQYCNQSNPVTCAKTNFKILLLEGGKSLSINMDATLEAAVIRDVLKDGRFFAIYMNVTAVMATNYGGFLNVTQIISPIIVRNETSVFTPLWIYFIAIVSGILIQLLITYALWKLGFFKRQTRDDMQQLLYEKVEIRETPALQNGASNHTFEDIDLSNAIKE